MCLLICRRGGDGALLLAANRDEVYDRPARGPFLWDAVPRVLAGRDERAGGTWLAVSDCGLVAAVANRPTIGGDDPSRPTRGELPLLACRWGSAGEARAALAAHLSGARYNGFTLLVADPVKAFVTECPGGEAAFRAVAPGDHAVANAGWDDRGDPRVARALELLPAGGGWGDLDGAVAALAGVCRDHHVLADGTSLCLHGREAGTRSSTVLAVGPDGRLRRYLHAPGPPCRAAYEPVPAPFG